jgi:hypothetical protein
MAKVFRVQKQVALKGARTASGQKIANVGRVWETIAVYRNKPTAERTAQGMRVDNPDGLIRIVEGDAKNASAQPEA